MLACVGLFGLKLHGLPQNLFRFLHPAGTFQHAADVLEGHQPMAETVGRDIGSDLGVGTPLLDGRVYQSAVLEDAAKVDMRRAELRIELEAGAKGIDCARPIAHHVRRDRIVEIGEMQQRIAVVIGDPALVEFDGLGLVPAVAKDSCDVEQIAESKLSLPRLLERISEQGELSRGRCDIDGHDDPTKMRPGGHRLSRRTRRFRLAT